MQVRQERSEIFKESKNKIHQPSIQDPVKLFFRNKGEITIFSDKQKLRELIINKSFLQEILKKDSSGIKKAI